MSNTMNLKPRISEKAYGQSLSLNTYVFVVPANANKHEVASAVATQFDVTVTNVNVTNVKGKAKRSFTKRRQANGQDSDFKKAYVTLKEGDQITVFANEDADKEPKGKKEKK